MNGESAGWSYFGFFFQSQWGWGDHSQQPKPHFQRGKQRKHAGSTMHEGGWGGGGEIRGWGCGGAKKKRRGAGIGSRGKKKSSLSGNRTLVYRVLPRMTGGARLDVRRNTGHYTNKEELVGRGARIWVHILALPLFSQWLAIIVCIHCRARLSSLLAAAESPSIAFQPQGTTGRTAYY